MNVRRYIPTNVRHLRRLLRGIPIGMLTTQTPAGGPRSRPMLMHDVDDSGWLWFLTDRSSRKACELNQNPYASVAFQSLSGKRFVLVEGTAIVVRDSLERKRVWNASYRSWFPKGKSDPSIALVALRVTRAEYWLVPRSRLARLAGALKAQLTGRRHENGLHGVLDLEPLFG